MDTQEDDFAAMMATFAAIGATYEPRVETDGFGLPEYRSGGMDYPPLVSAIRVGYTHFYFERLSGRFLGWWNAELSTWHPRNQEVPR